MLVHNCEQRRYRVIRIAVPQVGIESRFLERLLQARELRRADRDERIGIRGSPDGAMNGRRQGPDDRVLHLFVRQYCRDIQQQQRRLARAASLIVPVVRRDEAQ